MKAITVWQPWATLLGTGQKHNETRSWRTSYRGEILIHAAKTDHSGILLHIPMEELKHFQNAGVVNKLPTGAIIGKANLVDCFQIDEAYRRKLQRENPAELAFETRNPSLAGQAAATVLMSICSVILPREQQTASPLEALMAAVMHNAVKAKKGVEGDDPEKKDEKADEDIQKGD